MADMVALSLAIASTIMAATGMLFFKKAAGAKKTFFSREFFIGGFLFVLGTILMILALKREELSLVFPITSLTYIWVMIFSKIHLNEKINKWKILSVVFIAIGIILAVQ